MADLFTDEQQKFVENLIKSAVNNERETHDNVVASLTEKVEALQLRVARHSGDELVIDMTKELGDVPKKGSAAEATLVFPRHYEALNELPRPVGFRRGCERLDLRDRQEAIGFLEKKWFHSYDQLETVWSAESYLQDIFFCALDASVGFEEYRAMSKTAVNYVIALLRQKRQLLCFEGLAAGRNADKYQQKISQSLRNKYNMYAMESQVTDPTLKMHLEQQYSELLKAESKRAAGKISDKKENPAGGKPERDEK